MELRYRSLTEVDFPISRDTEHGTYEIRIRGKGGVKRETIINRDLVDTPQFHEVRAVASDLAVRLPSPFVVRVGELAVEATTYEEVAQAVEAQGRKGLSIQRYKGLGEMNAEQLWETTMDPTRRNLLQVRVDDSVDADKIFTVLMGDLVEPRRDFIEENALEVRNLDV
jgi:DNA gyrase subunit B